MASGLSASCPALVALVRGDVHGGARGATVVAPKPDEPVVAAPTVGVVGIHLISVFFSAQVVPPNLAVAKAAGRVVVNAGVVLPKRRRRPGPGSSISPQQSKKASIRFLHSTCFVPRLQ